MASNKVDKEDRLTDTDFAQLVPYMSSETMRNFAVKKLKLREDEVDTVAEQCGGNKEHFKRALLIKWRNKNSSKDERQKLFELFSEASREDGSIPFLLLNKLKGHEEEDDLQITEHFITKPAPTCNKKQTSNRWKTGITLGLVLTLAILIYHQPGETIMSVVVFVLFELYATNIENLFRQWLMQRRITQTVVGFCKMTVAAGLLLVSGVLTYQKPGVTAMTAAVLAVVFVLFGLYVSQSEPDFHRCSKASRRAQMAQKHLHLQY